MSRVKKTLIYLFLILSAGGLLLSLIIHMAALVRVTSLLGEETWLLHLGVLVVCIPAVVAAQRLTKDFPRKNFWKAVLRGCPLWMKYMIYFFFGYALLNFFIFLSIDIFGDPGDAEAPSAVFLYVSGHWMALYSAALAILYSALHAEEKDRQRRCPNGHLVSPLAKFCEECGQAVIERSA